jgi:hypothetical protein
MKFRFGMAETLMGVQTLFAFLSALAGDWIMVLAMWGGVGLNLASIWLRTRLEEDARCR